MRKTMAAMMLFACMFCAVSNTHAKKKNYYIKIDGLCVIESIDEYQTKNKFRGHINVDFSNSWGVQARIGYIFNRYFSTELMCEYIFPFEASLGTTEDKLDVMSFTMNGKFTYPIYKQIIPYVIVGVGPLNAYEDISYKGTNSTTNDWGFAIRGGLGVDYYINQNSSIGLESAYVNGLSDINHIKYITISLGIAYHF